MDLNGEKRVHMPWVDEKYVMLLDGVVERFRLVSRSPLTANFRCPICGDSKKNRHRARGYMYATPDGTFYKCHNCAATRNLRSFLRSEAPSLYGPYVMETRVKVDPEPTTKKSVERDRSSATPAARELRTLNLTRISELPSNHPAVEYWAARKLPMDRAPDSYWAPAFFKWVNDAVCPDKFGSDSLKRDHGRIVLPFRNSSGVVASVTGRSIGGEEPKYVAIRSSSGVPQCFYGEDRVDASRDVYVVEGPFDSMLIDNAVAMGTSSRTVPFERVVMVYDNEPRSDVIAGIVKRSIDAGDRVVVWPPGVPHKDLNEMHLAGIDVRSLVRERTFTGLRARIEFAEWRAG